MRWYSVTFNNSHEFTNMDSRIREFVAKNFGLFREDSGPLQVFDPDVPELHQAGGALEFPRLGMYAPVVLQADGA